MDEKFIADLPAGVDPCGENGEFHSFCFEGPIFKKKLSIITGEKVFRKSDMNSNGFWFCDLLKK
jgi:diphthamide synthase (EF-2-diphthine--ammonia ligase)